MTRVERFLHAALALSVFVIAALACGGGSRRSESVASTPATIHVTATDLFNAYTSNEIAADQRYKGKVATIEGRVDSIGKDIMDTPYLTLATGDSFMTVQAMFSKRDEGELARVTKGRQVTVKCRISGKFGNVLARDCSLR